ncbi:MAG TPA: hypothetical protein VFP00_04350 [Burkholderiales bacterium]|nr:hypothetical protein [Burkholderiales bacterium]
MAAAQSAQTPMGLLVAGFNFSGVAEDEFNDRYDTEHVPRLAQVPGVLVARRFRASGGTHRHIATYHLSGPEVCASKALEEAAVTPWTLKIRPATSDRLRLVFCVAMHEDEARRLVST